MRRICLLLVFLSLLCLTAFAEGPEPETFTLSFVGDLALVAGLGLDAAGAAMATVLAQAVSVALAVVGLYLLSCMGVSQINKGDLYLMGCALAFSVQITCIDRLAGNLDGLRMNCIQALVVTVLSVPFILPCMSATRYCGKIFSESSA